MTRLGVGPQTELFASCVAGRVLQMTATGNLVGRLPCRYKVKHMDNVKTFLHVGCGSSSKQAKLSSLAQSWQEVRLDINPDVKPDIIGTMTDMSALDSGSVDALYSSHNIEHLYQHEVPLALSEFRRVLKDDGFVIITCPDLVSVCRQIGEDRLLEPLYVSPAGPITPHDILYGFGKDIANGNHYMAHRCGFSEQSLRDTLIRTGFQSVATLRRPAQYDLWAVASKSERDGEALSHLAERFFFM